MPDATTAQAATAIGVAAMAGAIVAGWICWALWDAFLGSGRRPPARPEREFECPDCGGRLGLDATCFRCDPPYAGPFQRYDLGHGPRHDVLCRRARPPV